jgi:bifunctional DNase/RNase
MKNLPFKKLDLTKLDNLSTPAELERVKLHYNKLLYHSQTGQVVMVLDTDDKTVAYPLSEFEGAMASFVFLGCSMNSHIRTIHQMYLDLLEETGSHLEAAIIEAKHGDMFYATLEFRDKKDRKFRTLTSFSDAVLLAALASVDLFILRKVIDATDDFKDWTYLHEIIDNYDEEDD